VKLTRHTSYAEIVPYNSQTRIEVIFLNPGYQNSFEIDPMTENVYYLGGNDNNVMYYAFFKRLCDEKKRNNIHIK
jgi:hypothetical protein